MPAVGIIGILLAQPRAYNSGELKKLSVEVTKRFFLKELKKKNSARIQRGGDRGSNHKTIRFLSNTGPDPLENHIATKPACNVGQYNQLWTPMLFCL